MTTDSSKPIGQGPRPDWRLPNISGIEIHHIDYEARKLRHFESVLSRHRQAIEFLVHVDGPIPARAMGPALFIAGQTVTECEQVSPDMLRFLDFEPERLETGARISWGWINDLEEDRYETKFRFEY